MYAEIKKRVHIIIKREEREKKGYGLVFVQVYTILGLQNFNLFFL